MRFIPYGMAVHHKPSDNFLNIPALQKTFPFGGITGNFPVMSKLSHNP